VASLIDKTKTDLAAKVGDSVAIDELDLNQAFPDANGDAAKMKAWLESNPKLAELGLEGATPPIWVIQAPGQKPVTLTGLTLTVEQIETKINEVRGMSKSNSFQNQVVPGDQDPPKENE
jgi:hypothetical protein